eukprot:scaffold130003_cov37-Prasinocladus_malaysianus.AAC.2
MKHYAEEKKAERVRRLCCQHRIGRSNDVAETGVIDWAISRYSVIILFCHKHNASITGRYLTLFHPYKLDEVGGVQYTV